MNTTLFYLQYIDFILYEYIYSYYIFLLLIQANNNDICKKYTNDFDLIETIEGSIQSLSVHPFFRILHIFL